MKYPLFLIAIIFAFISCEDVIEVEVPTDEQRLVFDGLVRVDTTKEFVDVKVKVTKTSNFFGNIEVVSNIQDIYIYYGIENEFGEIIDGAFSNLTEIIPGSGVYEPDPNFSTDQRIRTQGLTDQFTFWLVADYEDRRYAAKTNYVTAVKIDNLQQGDGTLFNEDETEIIISYTDQPNKDNYYLFDFGFGNFLTTEDTFYKDQSFSFSYFYEEEFNPGDQITVSLLGANLDFYNYMSLLLEQSEGGGGPFQVPVATIRGNVFDVTGIDNINQFNNVNQTDNFPLGYFAVVESFSASIIIE